VQRIVIWLAATAVALALLFSYRTSTIGAPATASPRRSTTVKATVSLASVADQSVDGPVIDTRWGPVQVSVTVAGGRITDVQALQVPYDNGRDQEINDAAVPVLHDEAIAAQSANVDTVSGASYTSDGYRQSLQGALDALVAAAPSPAATTTAADPTTATTPEPPPTTGEAATGSSRTITGPVVDTRWGPVQVAAVIRKGRLADVKTLQVPNDNGRDQEINGYAVPILHDEAVAAQSANIDSVSGASYTSEGYRQSLQAALDQAGL
jgi:uncharacterized protein with FMN-binding domain